MAFALIARGKDGCLRLLDTQMFAAPRYAAARVEALVADARNDLQSVEILLADLDAALPILVVWPSSEQHTQPRHEAAPTSATVAEPPAAASPRLREDSDLFIIADDRQMTSLKRFIANVVDEVYAQREAEGTISVPAAPAASTPQTAAPAPTDAPTCNDCVFRETCPDVGSSAAAECGAFQRL